MGRDYRSDLLTLARTYGQATGQALATIGTAVHNTGSFFKNVEAGRTVTVDTLIKVWEWFDQHWPDEVEWPAGILRKLPFARREEAAIQMLPAQPGAEGRAVATSPAAQEVAA